MYRYCYILVLILSALLQTGCTRNEGDIGDFFGEWRLDRMTANGTDVTLYGDETGIELYTWEFQGKIIQINVNKPYHESDYRIGTWREEDGMLELNFAHHDDDPGHNVGMYVPPAALHLVAGGITMLYIDRMKNRRMTLSYTDDEGVTYCYYLKRPY